MAERTETITVTGKEIIHALQNLNGLGKFIIIFAISILGFAGGALALLLAGWLGSIFPKPSPSDAISIANTYIVFTTLFFVGVTIVLAIASYMLMVQFSAQREATLKELADTLMHKIKSNQKINGESGQEIGIQIANAVLSNPDVQRHLDDKIKAKMSEIVENHKLDAKNKASEAVAYNEALQSLNAQIDKD